MFVPRVIWLISSPDLKACEFLLLSVIEEQCNATSHSSAKSLRYATRRTFRKLDDEELRMTYPLSQQSVCEVIEAKGDHIENSYLKTCTD